MFPSRITSNCMQTVPDKFDPGVMVPYGTTGCRSTAELEPTFDIDTSKEPAFGWL